MNIELLKARMKQFFADVDPDALIKKYEEMGYKLVPIADETPSEPASEAVEWVNIRDNSEGFRKFLDSRQINWKQNEHGTLVPAETDLYWLGRHAEQAKQGEACVNKDQSPYNPIP